MYINLEMSAHVYRFKNKYLIAEMLVMAERLVRREINVAEYKMVDFLAGSELKRA